MARISLSIGAALATLNYSTTEQSSPSTDADLIIKDNGTQIVHETTTSSGTHTVPGGHSVDVIISSPTGSVGYTPIITLDVIQDGATICSRIIPIVGTSTIFTYSFIANPGSVYTITHTSSSYAYHYIRTQSFQKNDCILPQVGIIVSYSQEYVSNVSTMDAQTIAMADSSFVISGQANANANGICISPPPSDAVGILIIDIFNAADLCSYINTSGTIPYQIPVYTGSHNFEPNDGTSPALCYALASDPISGVGSLQRRFEINFGRLINENPSALSLVAVVRGRAASPGTLSGSYSLKDASGGYMTMTGTTGSYISSVSGTTTISTTSFSGITIGGSGDGTIGLTTGAIVMIFTYDNDPASSTYKQITLS